MTQPVCEQPLISVIMPAHNAGRFIEEAVQSVLNQTYGHLELIVIDDASSDNTPELVQAMAALDSRIKYHRAEPIGAPSGVRNVGLRLAQGDLIAFLDADDAYYPESLARRLQYLSDHPDCNAVYGFAQTMNEAGEDISQDFNLVQQGNGEYALPSGYHHSWKYILESGISCLLPGLMLRKSTLDRVGLFNEELCGPEDYQFYVRLFIDDFDAVSAIPLYAYRYRVYSSSLTKAPEKMERVLQSCLTLYDWLHAHPAVADEIAQYKHRSFTTVYSYLSRERILHGQPALARKIIAKGFADKRVPLSDWMRWCFPLLCRSLLPTGLDKLLVEAKRWGKQHKSQLQTQTTPS